MSSFKNLATATSLGVVKGSSSVKVGIDGSLTVDLPDSLTYKGTVNITTDDSGPDGIPAQHDKGDVYSVSWSSANSTRPIANSGTDWQTLTGDSGNTTIGDLVIVNDSANADANNAGAWTLVRTGTSGGAVIEVEDFETSGEPSNTGVGSLAYNLNDGRLYIRIKEAGGNDIWVDASPAGGDYLWKTEDSPLVITPAASANGLKIESLADGSESTTADSMAFLDNTGKFTRADPGAGLEMNNGTVRVKLDSSGTGVNLQTVCDAGSTTTTGGTFGGNLKCGSSAIFFEYRPANGVCQLKTNATTAAQAILYGQSGFGGSTFDAFKFTVDGSATFGSGNVTLNADGSIYSNNNPNLGDKVGVGLISSGIIRVTKDATDNVFEVWSKGDSARKIALRADGKGSFAGGDISLNADGSINAAQYYATVTGDYAFRINSKGGLYVDPSGNELLYLRDDSGSQPVITLDGTDGSAEFAGTVQVPNVNFGAGGAYGYISPSGSTLRIYSPPNGQVKLIGSGASGNLSFETNSNERLQITSNGTIQLPNGSPGIQFGTPNSGGNITSQTLDDYEEGTWTAACSNGVTLQSASNLCSYTKIGRVVTITGNVVVDNANGGVDFIINNIPFTHSAGAEGSGVNVGATRLSSVTFSGSIGVRANGNNLGFETYTSGAGVTGVTATSGGNYGFTCTYFTAS